MRPGLYDHLFGFRQWTLSVTPRLLRSFFGAEHDTALVAKCGWSVAHAEQLSAALVKTIHKEPQETHAAPICFRRGSMAPSWMGCCRISCTGRER